LASLLTKNKEMVDSMTSADEAKPVVTPKPEGRIEKFARINSEASTRASDLKLQNDYRQKKGLDEYNRPIRKVVVRTSGR